MYQIPIIESSIRNMVRRHRSLGRTTSLDKALDVLEQVAAFEQGATVAELSRELELPKPTVYRLVGRLSRRGYLISAGDRRLRLGLKFLGFSHLVPTGLEVRRASPPILEALIRTAEADIGGVGSAQLATLDRDQVVFLERVNGRSAFTLSTPVGGRVPAHCTALGKALLSQLPDAQIEALLRRADLVRLTSRTVVDPERLLSDIRRARRQGYATSVGEWDEDVWAAAAPVKEPGGSSRYAIGISHHIWRNSPEHLEVTARHVVAAAAQLSASLDAAAAPTRGHPRGH